MANEFLPADSLTWYRAQCRLGAEGLGAASRTVTYKRRTGQTLAPATQTLSPVYGTSFSVTGTRIDFVRREGKDQVAQGWVGYSFDHTRFTDQGITEPSANDLILDGSETYEVKDYELRLLAGRLTVLCQKQAGR